MNAIFSFSSSSIRSSDSIQKVVDIIADGIVRHGRIATIISPPSDFAEQLMRMSLLACDKQWKFTTMFKSLRESHLKSFAPFKSGRDYDIFLEQATIAMYELEEILHGLFFSNLISPQIVDSLTALAVRLSTCHVACALTAQSIIVDYIDARKIIFTDDNFGAAAVDEVETYHNLSSTLERIQGIPVITGGIGSTQGGVATSLGPRGSDYTASIFCRGTGAQVIERFLSQDDTVPAVLSHVSLIPVEEDVPIRVNYI